MKRNKLIVINCIFLFLIFGLKAQIHNVGAIHIQSENVSMFSNLINASTGVITNNGKLHLYNNLINNGSLNFTTKNSTSSAIFMGNNIQNITGSGNTNFHNVDIKNANVEPIIMLDKKVKINGKAHFVNGIIKTTDKGLIVFNSNAIHYGTSNSSFVEGKVKKIGNSKFIFPIGNHKNSEYYYRYASISAPSSDSDSFISEYILENSNSLYPHNQRQENIANINNSEYWIVERKLGNSNPKITLTWHSDTTPFQLLNTDTESLVIARWNGKKWINEGGTVNFLEKSVTANTTGYGIFTLASSYGKENSLPFKTGFSPNGDGVNDTYVIQNAAELYPNFELYIFNRLGIMVYSYQNKGSENPNWWDGTFSKKSLTIIGKGEVLPTGVYYYLFKYNKNNKKTKAGYIYLNK